MHNILFLKSFYVNWYYWFGKENVMELWFDILNLKFLSVSFEFDALDHPSRIILQRNRLYTTSRRSYCFFVIVQFWHEKVKRLLTSAFKTSIRVDNRMCLFFRNFLEEANFAFAWLRRVSIYIVVSEMSTLNAELFRFDDRLVIHFKNEAWVRRSLYFVGYYLLL